MPWGRPEVATTRYGHGSCGRHARLRPPTRKCRAHPSGRLRPPPLGPPPGAPPPPPPLRTPPLPAPPPAPRRHGNAAPTPAAGCGPAVATSRGAAAFLLVELAALAAQHAADE